MKNDFLFMGRESEEKKRKRKKKKKKKKKRRKELPVGFVWKMVCESSLCVCLALLGKQPA